MEGNLVLQHYWLYQWVPEHVSKTVFSPFPVCGEALEAGTGLLCTVLVQGDKVGWEEENKKQ